MTLFPYIRSVTSCLRNSATFVDILKVINSHRESWHLYFTILSLLFFRYYVICHCFHALMNVSRSRTMVIIFLVWLYACLWSVPPFMGIGAYVEEGYGIGCTFDYITRDLTTQIHIALLYVGGFALPILTIIICYVKIVLTVRKHRREIESYSAMPALSKDQKSSTQSKQTSMAIKKRGATTKFSRLMAHYQLSRVGIIATVIFSLSWGPYAIIALYSQFQQNNQTLNSPFQVMPVVFAKMSCIWNPFVYALSHKRFKKALIQTTRSFFRCSNTRASTHTDSQQMNIENSASGSSLRNRSYVLHSSELSRSSQGINLNQKQRAKTPVGYRHSDPGSNPSQHKHDLEIDTNTSNKLEGSKEIALEVISGSSSLRDGVHRSSWHAAHQRGHISSVIGNNYV